MLAPVGEHELLLFWLQLVLLLATARGLGALFQRWDQPAVVAVPGAGPRRVVALLVVALLLGGCARLATSAPSPPRLTEPPSEFLDAPTEVTLDGTSYSIGVRAWRNLQPHAGGGGVPSCANLCVRLEVLPTQEVDGPVPEVAALWALLPEGAASFGQVDVQGSTVIGGRGPRTEPGTSLTVIARLETPAGEAALVRSASIRVDDAA